jgi:hypothetical protein
MAITRIQGPARGTSTTTTISVTLSGTPVNGNVLVACIGGNPDTTTAVQSITQTGVTWSPVVGVSQYMTAEIWVGIVGSGASTSVSITLTASVAGAVADICEYSGLVTVSPVDKSNSAYDNGSPTSGLTGTTATTTQADELWVGIVCTGQVQSTPLNGFTLLDGAVSNYTSVSFLEKIVSATGTANSGTSWTGGYSCAGCIATFKASGATLKTVTDSLGLSDSILRHTKRARRAERVQQRRYPRAQPHRGLRRG